MENLISVDTVAEATSEKNAQQEKRHALYATKRDTLPKFAVQRNRKRKEIKERRGYNGTKTEISTWQHRTGKIINNKSGENVYVNTI